MLMLDESQVQKTEVYSHAGLESQLIPGISYKDRLFTATGSYEKRHKEDALEHCRQVFTDGEEQLMVLFLEHAEKFSVWVENPEVKLATPPVDRVATMPLKALVAKMRNINGIKIKDRKYRLKVYPQCFLGNEAVRWFIQNLKLSHEDALRMGQRLIDEKWIHHVADDHGFKDDELFYRFYWDEDSPLI